ncbi:UBX domain-containing protein [Heterostelium album PN500]|uniref:UBX domain-containing protein n=1 Tax=Heterostelium pallidum (strain ATCC 26659 / Pp 5 / PN500) TaxID=670386 RepID=D3BAQ6_HETP5|nr:UBX domain-containing protein [Heterostelium album PN500]EFA81643.1 UBX domain-containing protein [Heterostelium album PN500]|eukprot:XP_020433760.1 UBX domain-containing protein [Heterostelium album PN500]
MSEDNSTEIIESVFFNESFAEAVQQSKQTSKILAVVVYNEADTDGHPLLLDLFNYEQQLSDLIKSTFILKKIDVNSEDAINLKKIYPYSEEELPFFVTIGLNGVALHTSNGDKSSDELLSILTKSKEQYQQQQAQLLMLLMFQQQKQSQQAQQQQQQQQQQRPTNQQKPIASSSQQQQTSKTNTNNATNIKKETPKATPPKTTTTTTTTSSSTNNSNSSKKVMTSPTVKSKITSPTQSNKTIASPPLYTETTIVCKLTNGFSIKSTFSPNDKLHDVKSYIDKNRNDGKHAYYLMITYPKKIFTENDMSLSLRVLDLVPSATLTLCSSDPNSKPTPPPEVEPASSTTQYSTTSSTLESEDGGYIDKFKNYVSSIFSPFWYPPASQQTTTTSTTSSSAAAYPGSQQRQQTTPSNRPSSSGIRQVGRIHTLSNDNSTPQPQQQQQQGGFFQPIEKNEEKKEEQTNVKKRNRIGQLHQSEDDNQDGKNSYYNGNSTQYK